MTQLSEKEAFSKTDDVGEIVVEACCEGGEIVEGFCCTKVGITGFLGLGLFNIVSKEIFEAALKLLAAVK